MDGNSDTINIDADTSPVIFSASPLNKDDDHVQQPPPPDSLLISMAPICQDDVQVTNPPSLRLVHVMDVLGVLSYIAQGALMIYEEATLLGIVLLVVACMVLMAELYLVVVQYKYKKSGREFEVSLFTCFVAVVNGFLVACILFLSLVISWLIATVVDEDDPEDSVWIFKKDSLAMIGLNILQMASLVVSSCSIARIRFIMQRNKRNVKAQRGFNSASNPAADGKMDYTASTGPSAVSGASGLSPSRFMLATPDTREKKKTTRGFTTTGRPGGAISHVVNGTTEPLPLHHPHQKL